MLNKNREPIDFVYCILCWELQITINSCCLLLCVFVLVLWKELARFGWYLLHRARGGTLASGVPSPWMEIGDRDIRGHAAAG